MATVISQATHGSYPGMTYRLDAEQTGGSGNSRTVKITLYLKCGGSTSSSWYGFPVQWKGRINNSYSDWINVKGTESWNGTNSFRTFTWTATVDVGTTSSKAITVGFQTNSYSGDDSWDLTKTGSFTVGSTNVAPVLSGSISTNVSGTIGENTSSIALTSPTATDGNNNLSGYRFAVSVNGGGYTEIYKGSSRTYTHSISGGEGTTYKYSCYAYDASGANSSTIYSGTITKNKMTGDTLASSSSISYSSSSIGFTYSGAANTNGNTSFTRTLTCDGLTVYNGSLGASPATVTIYKSGTVPSTCYVKFDDIKNKFASASYKGTLTFTLATKNAYGTTKTSSKAISVNLQTAPNAATGQAISTDSAKSTMYRTIIGSNKYFVPNGSLVAQVGWTAGSGKLGEAVKYDLYVAYGSGSWQLLASDLTTTTYNHAIATQSVSQQFKYLVRTKVAYGLYSDATTAAQTLHYWNAPGLTPGTITRGATTADVVVTIKTNSSIPNIETVGTWKLYTKGTTTQVGSNAGNLTVTQNAQTIKTTGLTDSGQYDLSITYKDNTTLSANKTATIAIGANSPLFFVNKYGVGVNGAKATSANSLVSNGNALIQGPMPELRIKAVGGSVTSSRLYLDRGTGASWDLYSHNGPLRIRCNYTDKVGDFYDAMTIAHNTGNVWCKGTLNAAGGLQSNGKNVLTTAGGTITGTLNINGNSKNLQLGTGGSDVYLRNDKTSKYLQLRDDGLLAWSGNKIYDASDAATSGTASKLAMRDSNGDISCRLVKASYQNETRMTGGVCFRVNNSSDPYMRFCSDAGAFRGWLELGSVLAGAAPRITNLNSRLNTGWYSWTSGTSNAPVTYGVLFTIQWSSGGDFYQLAIGSNNALYTRSYVNGAYTSWSTK